MKNFSKIISLLIVIILCLTILAGCAQDELLLLNALCKQPDINSYESKTEVTVKLTSEGLNGSDKESFDQIASMLNGMKIAVNLKATGNKEKTLAKTQTDVNVSMDGISSEITAWSDTDLTGDTPKIKQVVKIPKLLFDILSIYSDSDMTNKEYLVIDMGEVLSTGNSEKSNLFSKEYLEYSRNLTPKFIDFIKAYAREFNPGFSIVTSKGTLTDGNQTVTAYNLKLDDANFKKLLSNTVTNFVQSESAMNFIRNLILDSIRLSDLSYKERLIAQGEINKSFDEFKTDLPEFLKNWENIMSILNDVKILGDKGINIEFFINNDGFIVSQKGTMDFVINLKEINTALEKYASLTDEDYIASEIKDEGTVKFEVNFNTEITKINKNVVVDIPEVTPENSLNFMELVGPILNFSTARMEGQFEPDTTPPDAPTVNKVLLTSNAVSGNSEAYSVITIKKGSTIIGQGMADETGAFNITIVPLKTKSTLTVTATDVYGNESAATTVKVGS